MQPGFSFNYAGENKYFSAEGTYKIDDSEYSDIEERIERLSSYVASTGKSYKSHYATIRNWARKDKPKQQKQPETPEFLKKWSV